MMRRSVQLTAAAAGLAAFVWAGPALAAFGDPDLIWGPAASPLRISRA